MLQPQQADAQLTDERDLFRTLLEHFPDVIYFKDAQSRFVHYSKSSFAKLFGLADADALKGKTDADFFAQEHARAAYLDEQEIMATGEPILGKVERETHVDGRVTWALTSKMPWRDKAGNIIGTFGISKDLTALRQMEEALRQSEERFQSAFEHAAIGMALTAPDGHLLKVNRAFCEMTGYDEAELLRKTFQEITHPEDLESNLRLAHKALLGELRTYQVEKRYLHKSGQVVWSLLTVSLVRDSLGEPLHFISQIQDISERKQGQEQRERLIQELQTALAQVKTLSGLLPICANCKKIRDDKGYWTQVEFYIRDRSNADFTHSICPECAKRLYPALCEPGGPS